MGYSRLYLNIVARVILITATCFLFVVAIESEGYVYTSFGIGILLIGQVYLFINFFTKTHKYLTNFLLQIKEVKNVSSIPIIRKQTPYYEFNHYFEEIIKIIRSAKIEKENQYHYLQYVVDHVGVGLIAFDEKGKVELFNDAAKQLLQIPILKNIKTLDAIFKGLSNSLLKLKPQKQKLITANINDELLHLSIKAVEFKILEKNIKLVSIQDIKSELDQKEIESWQKLIRILNHEIMNSITPITTLTTALVRSFKNENGIKTKDEMDEELISETVTALNLIEDRGKGLIDFVNKYRSLSANIKPKIADVLVKKLFENVNVLFRDNFAKRKIIFSASVEPEDLSISADDKLIEQILINLVKNSIEAIDGVEQGKISLRAGQVNDRKIIKVSDNGKGITAVEIDNIFVPFYTTKESGSGIGLSLARQIMRAHKGEIKVSSVIGRETTFSLIF